jgi:hypothetical protein
MVANLHKASLSAVEDLIRTAHALPVRLPQKVMLKAKLKGA